MLKTRKAFLVLFLFLTACTPPAPNVEGENWVAFSAEDAQADQMLDWLFTDDVEYWSPTEADIQSVEDGLPDYLRENQSSFYITGSPVWERLNEYNRQYVGLVLEGKKVIYANYFCNATGLDWKKEFVMVLDGGACYFQFKFNTDSGEYFGLQVNGEA